MREPVFIIDSLSAGYNKVNVIGNISLGISGGEFVSLIGPNGAGKSTLIKAISGAIPITGGRIYFHGRDINDYGKRELAAMMSVVNPVTGEIPAFTVRMFLSFGLFPHRKLFSFTGDNEEIIGETADLCGITGLLERPINGLSAGEFQLVQISRALIQNRDVILLDEPVSNLDYRHMIQVMDILTALNRGGATIICALHDVNIAAEYSSRIIAVNRGAVFFDGKPESVITEKSLSGLYESRFHCGKNPVTGRPSVYPVPGSSV
jgi:iron complex transport system ATP-binding protein